ETGRMVAQHMAIENNTSAEHGFGNFQRGGFRDGAFQFKSAPIPKGVPARVFLRYGFPVSHLGTRLDKRGLGQRNQPRNGNRMAKGSRNLIRFPFGDLPRSIQGYN